MVILIVFALLLSALATCSNEPWRCPLCLLPIPPDLLFTGAVLLDDDESVTAEGASERDEAVDKEDEGEIDRLDMLAVLSEDGVVTASSSGFGAATSVGDGS